SAVMRNVTTGQQLEFTATLSEGEQIVIDTRPRRKTVRDGTGANMFAALTVGSVLWPLAPGANVIDVELTGLSDASRLELEITPRELPAEESRVDEWSLPVRDESLDHIGVIEDGYALEATERHPALGAWKIGRAADGPGAELLREGAGILLVDRAGRTLVSGPIRPQETQRAADGHTLSVSGVTDTAALGRLCWPRPTQDIPDTGATQDDAYYVVAG